MASSNNLAVYFRATLTKIQTLQRQQLVVVPFAIYPYAERALHTQAANFIKRINQPLS